MRECLFLLCRGQPIPNRSEETSLLQAGNLRHYACHRVGIVLPLLQQAVGGFRERAFQSPGKEIVRRPVDMEGAVTLQEICETLPRVFKDM